MMKMTCSRDVPKLSTGIAILVAVSALEWLMSMLVADCAQYICLTQSSAAVIAAIGSCLIPP